MLRSLCASVFLFEYIPKIYSLGIHGASSHTHVHKKHGHPKCEDGFELIPEKSKCVKVEVRPFDVICPAETDDIAGHCYETLPIQYRCPDDYLFVDNHMNHQCIKKLYAKATPECKNGFELNGKECTRLLPGNRYCEQPFTLRSPFCEMSVGRQHRCPETYELMHDECVREVLYPKIDVCDEGYVLNMEMGMCSRTIEQEISCPHGWILQDNKCLQFARRIKECPDGFIEETGGQCVKMTSSNKTFICINGGKLQGGKCVYETTTKHTVCKKGVRIDDKCVVSKTADYDLTCPFGYKLEGSICTKIEYYECVKNEPKQCYEPLQKADAYTHTHDLHAKKDYLKHKLMMHHETPVEENIHCWKKNFQVQQKCERTRTMDALRQCPPGYTFRDKACVSSGVHDLDILILPPIVEYSEPLISCERGYPPECIYTERVGVNYMCPEGFQPSHEQEEVCVRFDVPLSPPPIIDSIPIRSVCPDEGCIHTMTLPMEFYCEEGFVDEGEHCVKRLHTLKKPDEVLTKEPAFVCPVGYENNGHECFKQHTVSASETCPTNFTVLHGKCVFQVDAIQTCAQGEATLTGCAVKLIHEPTIHTHI